MQKNIRKYARRYPLWPRVACRCWGWGIAVKMAKWSVCPTRLDYIASSSICQILLLCLTLFWCSVPLFPFSLSSTFMLGLLLLHFGSRTIFFTRRLPPGWTNTTWPLLHFSTHMIFFTSHLPPGWTSTTWLVVWGRDHRNHGHTIKVWRICNIYIYIYTYIQTWTDYTARLVASR